jgi:DNA-binding helix-hairpin-helix protein with protein kinase domain
MFAIFSDGHIEALDIDTSGRGLGRGATANVYKAISDQGNIYAAKIFHDSGSIDIKRLKALINHNPLNKTDTSHLGFDFTWPIAAISKNKKLTGVVGFLMNLVNMDESYPLSSSFTSPLRQSSTNKHWPLNIRTLIAQRLCSALSLLHENYFVVCDFKPENLRITKAGEIVFLDCDSFGVIAPSYAIAPTHFSAGYISPELLNGNLSPAKADLNQDLFALAVLLFKIFNYGVHPFQGILKVEMACDTDDEKVRMGLYPYGVIDNNRISPIKTSVHECLPMDIRYLFDRSFNTVNRSTASDWVLVLTKYIENFGFSKCSIESKSVDHIKFEHNECCVCKLKNISIKINSERDIDRESQSKSKNDNIKSQSYQPQYSPITPKSNEPSFFDNLGRALVVCGLIFIVALIAIELLKDYSNNKPTVVVPSPVSTANPTSVPQLLTLSDRVNYLDSIKTGAYISLNTIPNTESSINIYRLVDEHIINKFTGEKVKIKVVDGLEIYSDVFLGPIKTVNFIIYDTNYCNKDDKPNSICIVENNKARCQSIVQGKYICVHSFSKD